jgi:hypothetical protein
MAQPKRNKGLFALTAGTVFLAAFGLVALPRVAQSAAPPGPGKLIVHEWGTFLSVQAPDGVTLGGMIESEEDLPPFVRQRGLDGRNRLFFTSKVETPVTYFYVDRPMTVEMRADMPTGLLTHWFPAVQSFGPPPTAGPGPAPAGSFLDWGRFLVLPRGGPGVPALREAGKGSDWNFVRNTDSALVYVPNPVVRRPGLVVSTKDNLTIAGTKVRETRTELVLRTSTGHDHAIPLASISGRAATTIEQRRFPYMRPEGETEKFLFYRGLAALDQPLEVRAEDGGKGGGPKLTVSNLGRETLRGIFLVRVEKDAISVAPVADLGPGGCKGRRAIPVELGKRRPLAAGVPAAKRQVADALVKAGLYRKEAEAMVNNWERSYFRTEGLRVLYVLPRATVDEALPIRIHPKPQELQRVMEGRVEVLTPKTLRDVERALTVLSTACPVRAHGAVLVKEAQAVLAQLGRLREPVLRRIAATTKDVAVRKKAEELLQELLVRC